MLAPANSGRLRTKSGHSPARLKTTDAEPGTLDALQPRCRNDLVRIDVASIQWRRRAADDSDWLHRHYPNSAGVANVPAIAVAAATAGETR